MSEPRQHPSCEDRIDAELGERLADLRQLWTAYEHGREDEQDSIRDYGLAFDYVEPHTFDGQKEAYFRYQLSWGGPSDEFRFFVNPDFTCHRIEYRFMDWFDGACRILSCDDEKLLAELFDWLHEVSNCGPT